MIETSRYCRRMLTVALLLEDLLEAADGYLIFKEVLANRVVKITERTRANGRQVVGLVGTVFDPDTNKCCRERRVYRHERRDGVASVLKSPDGDGQCRGPAGPTGTWLLSTVGADRMVHRWYQDTFWVESSPHTPLPWCSSNKGKTAMLNAQDRAACKVGQLKMSAPHSTTLGKTILSTALPVLTSRILTVLRRSRSAAIQEATTTAMSTIQ